MADLTKVSIPLLDMAGIAEYLNIVSKFITDKDKATDTKNVAGVFAEYVAIADTSKRDPQGNILCDRETIKNSLHLDGHPVEYFLTADKGGVISSGLAKTNNTEKSLQILRMNSISSVMSWLRRVSLICIHPMQDSTTPLEVLFLFILRVSRLLRRRTLSALSLRCLFS